MSGVESIYHAGGRNTLDSRFQNRAGRGLGGSEFSHRLVETDPLLPDNTNRYSKLLVL